MLKDYHWHTIIFSVLVLIISFPIFLFITAQGGKYTTSWIIFGIILLAGIFILVYEKGVASGQYSFRTRKKRFKLFYRPESDQDRLKDYIKNAKSLGYSHYKIRKQLEDANWHDNMINRFLK